MSDPIEPEETVEVVVDVMEGKPNPMADLVRSVPAVADMKLDMTKDEKLRTTALMMAVAYHRDTVVNDGELYQQMKLDQKTLTPTRPQIVVEYAWHFEKYLRGESEVVNALEEALRDRIEAYLKAKIDEDFAQGDEDPEDEDPKDEEEHITPAPGSEPG